MKREKRKKEDGCMSDFGDQLIISVILGEGINE
jgi:hypothetical protein